jgi:GxxExxY protein
MSIIKPEYKHSDITAKILAAAFEVHSTIGCGFLESVYHRSMEIELRNRKILFISEKEMTIYYKNQKVGSRRVDLFVENVVSTELKAVTCLDNSNLAQGINYIEAFKIEIGLLINFGARKLEFKRLVNPKLLRNK